jgi:hypothetical protein
MIKKKYFHELGRVYSLIDDKKLQYFFYFCYGSC